MCISQTAISGKGEGEQSRRLAGGSVISRKGEGEQSQYLFVGGSVISRKGEGEQSQYLFVGGSVISRKGGKGTMPSQLKVGTDGGGGW